MPVWSSRLNGGSVVADPGTPDIYNQRLNAPSGATIDQTYAVLTYVVVDYILEDTTAIFARFSRAPGTRVDNVTPAPRVLPV